MLKKVLFTLSPRSEDYSSCVCVCVCVCVRACVRACVRVTMAVIYYMCNYDVVN